MVTPTSRTKNSNKSTRNLPVTPEWPPHSLRSKRNGSITSKPNTIESNLPPRRRIASKGEGMLQTFFLFPKKSPYFMLFNTEIHRFSTFKIKTFDSIIWKTQLFIFISEDQWSLKMVKVNWPKNPQISEFVIRVNMCHYKNQICLKKNPTFLF